MTERICIVGASLAGATAAVTLRKEGFDGDVLLVGEEPHLPYERPPLSKSYLRGESTFEDTLVRAGGVYEDSGIELRLSTRASSIDTERKRVRLNRGEELPYDQLLLATGCRNRAPDIPGAHLAGVHTLRTIDDADALRGDAVPGRTAVIGGMSFIGSEVAASLRQLGLDVTGIVSSAFPLEKVLGPEVGEELAKIHLEHGVHLVADDRVAAIEGETRVERVITTKGRLIPCDVAVLAIGVEPVVDLAAGTPIEVDDGIVADELFRTNVLGVFAAGDVANAFHPVFGRTLRVEHWQNARRQGRAAARSMLGKGRPFDQIPWFWSDQYEHQIQYTGSHIEGDLLVADAGDAPGFSGSYIGDGGVVRAAVALDRGLGRATETIASRRPVERHPLARGLG